MFNLSPWLALKSWNTICVVSLLPQGFFPGFSCVWTDVCKMTSVCIYLKNNNYDCEWDVYNVYICIFVFAIDLDQWEVQLVDHWGRCHQHERPVHSHDAAKKTKQHPTWSSCIGRQMYTTWKWCRATLCRIRGSK